MYETYQIQYTIDIYLMWNCDIIILRKYLWICTDPLLKMKFDEHFLQSFIFGDPYPVNIFEKVAYVKKTKKQ